MHIEIDQGTMIVHGTIKTIDDSKLFEEKMRLAIQNGFLTIRISSSFIVTSAIIGSMLKAVKDDKVNLSLCVKNNDLYRLLEYLRLEQTLNVKRY